MEVSHIQNTGFLKPGSTFLSLSGVLNPRSLYEFWPFCSTTESEDDQLTVSICNISERRAPPTIYQRESHDTVYKVRVPPDVYDDECTLVMTEEIRPCPSDVPVWWRQM